MCVCSNLPWEAFSRATAYDGVAAVIAGILSWDQANDVLHRLLLNASSGQAHTYIELTNTALVANLPSDVVKILAWAAVVSGPTGTMPQDFWSKIGAIASAVVNTLVQFGQMIYKGLVALGTFLVNLAEAIADWGMKALGAVVNAAVSVAQAAANALNQLVSWLSRAVSDLIRAVIDIIVRPILDTFANFVRGLSDLIKGNLRGKTAGSAGSLCAQAVGTSPPISQSTPMDVSMAFAGVADYVLGSVLYSVLAGLVYAALGIEIVVKVLTAGLATLIDFAAGFFKKHLQDVIISAIVTAACIVAANNAVGSLSGTYSDTGLGVIQAAANAMSNSAAGIMSNVLLGLADVGFSLYLVFKARMLGLALFKVFGEAVGLALAFIGLVASIYSSVTASGPDQVALDLTALVISLVGFQMALFSSGDAFSWVAKAADLLASVSLAVDLVTVAGRNYNSG